MSGDSSSQVNWVRVGIITRPHGVRGGLRLHLDNPDSDLLDAGLTVQLRRRLRGEEQRTEHIVARVFGAGDRLELEDLTDRDAANALRGAEVCVDRDAFPDLDEDESYLVDLIGVEVRDREGVRLGVIEGFADNGAQPLAQIMVGVKRGRKRFVEFPFVAELIVGLDEETDVLTVDPPEGLFRGDAEVAGDAQDKQTRAPREGSGS